MDNVWKIYSTGNRTLQKDEPIFHKIPKLPNKTYIDDLIVTLFTINNVFKQMDQLEVV